MGHWKCPECGHDKCICPGKTDWQGEVIPETDDSMVVGRVVLKPNNKGESDVRRVPRRVDDMSKGEDPPEKQYETTMPNPGDVVESLLGLKEEQEKKSEPQPTPILTSIKDTNPKDTVGTKKWRQYCTVPTTIIWELGVAMLEGARKYGRHNYRVAGVRASVYFYGAKGHIAQWWEW